MTAHKIEDPDVVDAQAEILNEVRLTGRLAADPVLRDRASGESVWHLTVVVDRLAPRGKEKPRQRADWLECTVGSGRLTRQVKGWCADDVVQVAGSLQRRFFRVGGATMSRVEVELTQGRLIRRAGSG